MAKSRIPSTYSYIHFDAGKKVVFRENTDKCLRASFGNDLAVLNGQSVALRQWRGQCERHNCVLLEQSYGNQFRRIGHFVTHVEETIPGVTVRREYESNGAHFARPRTDFFRTTQGSWCFPVENSLFWWLSVFDMHLYTRAAGFDI